MELFENEASDEDTQAAMTQLMQSGQFPNIAQMLTAVAHDGDTVVGKGCDDEFEFEFAMDLLLDGIERLREREIAAST